MDKGYPEFGYWLNATGGRRMGGYGHVDSFRSADDLRLLVARLPDVLWHDAQLHLHHQHLQLVEEF